MKKTLSIILLLLSITVAFGQYSNSKKKSKERKDDFSITVKENEKNIIDWKMLKNYFEDRNKKDSIQFSVKLVLQKNNNFTSENKYTVKGLAEDFDELVESMKKLMD